MRKVASHLALGAAGLLVACCLLLPGLASADKDFTGRIDKISKKKMIVDNRMGDKLTFVYVNGVTVVEGEKAEWSKLKKKDWVTVTWKMIDNPRKAYKVVVIPNPKPDDD
jgi:hypothetical protein